MKHLWLLIAIASVSLASTFGCGDDGADASSSDGGVAALPRGAALVQSDLARDRAPDVSASDQTALGSGNRTFAWDLYHELRAQPGNLFLSPYSISVALAMTYAGAKSETAAQMASTLHFDLEPSTLHAAFNATDLALASRGKTSKGKDNEPFQLHVVNQTWGQKDFTFLPSFLDTLALNYGAGMFLLDFKADPEKARVAINDWVADQTAQRIRNLIRKDIIDGRTRLVLTNAVYFNAAWHVAFDEAHTKDGTFTTPSGPVSAKLMQQTAVLPYAEGDGYQAVEIPYDEEAIVFLAVLPSEGRFDEIEAAFDDARFREAQDGMTDRSTTITMPRFEFESPFDLGTPLQKLGMVDAFNAGTADFSGIDGGRDLFVQAVMHKAFIDVDEAGTEAAAATAVIIGTKGGKPDPATITLDRPFLFAIVDQPTGQILFLGRVLDPS